MSNRVIVITGANGSLGRAIANVFLNESPDNIIWLAVHSRRENADQLAASHPQHCRVASLDVTDAAAWKQLVAQILARDQRLDVLVNDEVGIVARSTVGQSRWRVPRLPGGAARDD
jgi:NAD(P)-dependent dehydrogenase (short-subunit alcohol dehydrogenase family)